MAEGLWIVDSGPLRMLGMPLPVRMTVIQLADGDLWLHSPTRFDAELKAAMERQGPIRHLVAPDIAHWTFLEEWQRNCPDAITWAAPELRKRAVVRKSAVRLDRDLAEQPPAEWAGQIEQVIVPGAAGFREMDFFHTASRTLILTDLVLNLEPGKLPLPMRLFGRLAGVLAPDGMAPIYLRALIKARRQEAAAAAARMLTWEPHAVIFSHGRWFERDGAAQLAKSLRWLVPGGGSSSPR